MADETASTAPIGASQSERSKGSLERVGKIARLRQGKSHRAKSAYIKTNANRGTAPCGGRVRRLPSLPHKAFVLQLLRSPFCGTRRRQGFQRSRGWASTSNPQSGTWARAKSPLTPRHRGRSDRFLPHETANGEPRPTSYHRTTGKGRDAPKFTAVPRAIIPEKDVRPTAVHLHSVGRARANEAHPGYPPQAREDVAWGKPPSR